MLAFETDSMLLVISQIAGIILLGCTMLLIGLRRIYFDAETKKPIEIEMPILGKVKTHAQALALIVVAAFMVVYPIARPHNEQVTVEGTVETTGKAVTLLVVALPGSEQTVDSSGHFTLRIPLIKDATYRVRYEVDHQIVHDEEPKRTKNGFVLDPYRWTSSGSEIPIVTPQKDISDEALHNLRIIK